MRDLTITVTQQDGLHHHSTTRRREEDSVGEEAVVGPLLEREGEEVLEENVMQASEEASGEASPSGPKEAEGVNKD